MINSKNNTIGIPRALSYYYNYPFYYGFFESLGIEIILSDKTVAKIINDGVKTLASETCFPVKVFTGHVINLLEKGCDKIFIPSLQSTGYKINNCSKIRGLPEIIRNVIDRPFTMIEPTLDKTEKISLKDFCFQIAKYYDITDKKTVETAIKKGFEIYNNFFSMTKSGISYTDALESALKNKTVSAKISVSKPVSVVIMAHGYNLFDERISLNIVKKLEKMNVKVYTGLNIDRDTAIKSIADMGEIQYWANEPELTGTAAYYINKGNIDGIIALSAFGCGPDSLMIDEISYHCRKRNLPIIHLTVDEHTGEAGFITRLEAFTDMLLRKKLKTFNDSRRRIVTVKDKTEKIKIETAVG